MTYDILSELSAAYTKKIPGSKYFTWGEALFMRKSKAYARPTAEQLRNIITLAGHLDKVREFYNSPILIHSWLRTPAHNALIRGALQSTHLTGSAVDFSINNVDAIKIQKDLMSNKEVWPYRGEMGTLGWVHLDLNPGPWFMP